MEYHSTRNKPACASLAGFAVTSVQMLQAIVDGSIPVKGNGQTNIITRASTMLNWLGGGGLESLTEQAESLFNPSLVETLAESDEEKKKWIATDLTLLRDAVLTLIQNGVSNFNSIMEIPRYRIATRAPLLDNNYDVHVRIMTLHSAKGLQEENVIIASVADQMIPGIRADDLREEQRRLLYVGFTGARNILIVSWPRSIGYACEKANRIRIDQQSIITESSGTGRVKLTKSSLLPQALSGVQRGETWLEKQLS